MQSSSETADNGSLRHRFPSAQEGKGAFKGPRIKKVINMSPTEVIDKGFTHWQGTLGGVKQRFRLA